MDSDPDIRGGSEGPAGLAGSVPLGQHGGVESDFGRLSSHLVLFYRDDDEFAERACEFLRPAIERDGSAVFIGTQTHRSLVQARLEADGLDLASYVSLDVSEVMGRFVIAGWPDPGGFWRVAEPLVARSPRVAETARNQRPVRVVEETVARLWEAGAVSAALELETMWSELAERYPFALLCAYPASSVAGRHHDAALAQVRRLHDSVVSAPITGALAGDAPVVGAAGAPPPSSRT